jgi:hypothetical protein
MHRVARELAHQECGWKHSEGHGVVALDYEGVRHVGLDKMCLLMEVRLREPRTGGGMFSPLIMPLRWGRVVRPDC